MQYYHEDIRYHSDLDIILRVHEGYGSYVAKHWHNSLELIYVIQGVQEFSISNGKMRPVYANDFLLINSREIHSFQSKSYLKTMLLQLPYTFLKKYIPEIDTIRFCCSNKSGAHAASPAYTHILCLLSGILKLYPLESSVSVLRFHSLVFDLLATMLCSFRETIPSIESEQTQKYIARLGRITTFVKEHYAEPITLKQAAEEVSLNPDYFTRFFKKYMGMTFLDYVHSVRLEKIDQDLLETDLSIQELLERHGFTNYKRFMDLYKSRHGCTPGQMRKQALRNNQ